MSCSAFVVCVPQHIVEEQLFGIGRSQPAVFKTRPVHNHLAQCADFGADSK